MLLPIIVLFGRSLKWPSNF